MKRICLFIVVFAILLLFPAAQGNNLDVLLSFRVNVTNTMSCPNQTACANPQRILWTLKLGGIPEGICQERCSLLFYVNFGAHNASVKSGSVFNASNYTTKRDLYRFFDLLNNFYPYILGYQIESTFGGFGTFGGINITNVTNKTIDEIQVTINKITTNSSSVNGKPAVIVSFDLLFSVLGNAHANLTNVTEITIGDSFVRNGTNRNTNYGNLTYLEIHDAFGLPNETSVTYLSFNLLNYTTLNKATLRLYGSANDSDGQVVAMVHSVNGTFNESSITWQNAPPVWLSASLFDTRIFNETWYYFDITPLVREEFPNGGGALYIAVVVSSSGGPARFSSREGKQAPQLLLYSVLPSANNSTATPSSSPTIVSPSANPIASPTSSSTPAASSPVTIPSTVVPYAPVSNTNQQSNASFKLVRFSSLVAIVVGAILLF